MANMVETKTIALFLALLLSAAPAISLGAEAAPSTADYYNDRPKDGEGYWWYHDAEAQKKEEKKKDEEKTAEPEKKHRIPSLKDYPVEKLWAMHPDDFQALLLDFQKKAVMDLSPESLKEYSFMEDIARRKSLAFANVKAYVTQTTPELSLEKDYPLTRAGRSAQMAVEEKDLKGLLTDARDSFALVYFYSPSCPYCTAQDGIMQYFLNRYGWTVKKINKEENAGLAAKFNVTMTPTLLMISKGESDFIPISFGVISLPDLEQRIYRGIRLVRKEISPQEFSTYEYQRGGGFDPLAPLKK